MGGGGRIEDHDIIVLKQRLKRFPAAQAVGESSGVAWRAAGGKQVKTSRYSDDSQGRGGAGCRWRFQPLNPAGVHLDSEIAMQCRPAEIAIDEQGPAFV